MCNCGTETTHSHAFWYLYHNGVTEVCGFTCCHWFINVAIRYRMTWRYKNMPTRCRPRQMSHDVWAPSVLIRKLSSMLNPFEIVPASLLPPSPPSKTAVAAKCLYSSTFTNTSHPKLTCTKSFIRFFKNQPTSRQNSQFSRIVLLGNLPGFNLSYSLTDYFQPTILLLNF